MDCEKHPGPDNIIVCFDCGKSFCRLCHPLKGAGQYCPACYQNQLSRLSQKPVKAPGGKRANRVRRVVSSGAREPGQKAKAAFSFPGETAIKAREHLEGRFPLTLVEKERMGELPPFGEAWLKLLASVLGGTVTWVIIASLLHQRNPLASMGVSVLVASGVVWAYGTKNDARVAVLSVMGALVALVLGEMTVQALVRLGAITRMDFRPISLYSLNHTGGLFRDYMWRLLFHRVLPGAALAFLTGLWPFKRRLSWKGFEKPTRPRPELLSPVEGED